MPVRFRWEKDFKDTEIGRIPRDWEVRRIGDVVNRIIKGKVPKKPRNDNNSVEKLPYLSVEYIRGGTIQTKLFPASWGVPVNEEDILIIWDGAANAGEILKGKKGLLSSTVAKLKINEEVNKSFFFNYLKLNEDSLKSLRSGTDNRHVDKQALLDYLVPLPHLPEQSRIAEVLSWFDELIEVKKKQNEILEKTAMAIFKSWFIDFEPFQDEDFIYSEELGREIPKGWGVKRLSEVIILLRDGTHNPPPRVEKGIPLLVSKNVKFYGIDTTGITYISNEDYHRIHKRYKPEEGDIVMTKIGIIGEVTMLNKDDLPIAIHCNVALIRPDKDKIDNYYLLYYMKSNLYQEQLQQRIQQTAQEFIPLNNIADTMVLLPPQPILQKFHSLVQPLFEKIINNQKEIMILKKVRDTLLPLLVFGKLRVEEV